MRKVLIVMAAMAVMAVVLPSSAFAAGACGTSTACGWSGWNGEHGDNLAGPSYASEFAFNGAGDSRYCVAPFATPDASDNDGLPVPTADDDKCDGPDVVSSPVVFGGVFCGGSACTGASQGCGLHPDRTGAGNPCTNGDVFGAFFIGTGAQGDSATPVAAGVPVYTDTNCQSSDVVCNETGRSVGVGLQG